MPKDTLEERTKEALSPYEMDISKAVFEQSMKVVFNSPELAKLSREERQKKIRAIHKEIEVQERAKPRLAIE